MAYEAIKTISLTSGYGKAEVSFTDISQLSPYDQKVEIGVHARVFATNDNGRAYRIAWTMYLDGATDSNNTYWYDGTVPASGTDVMAIDTPVVKSVFFRSSQNQTLHIRFRLYRADGNGSFSSGSEELKGVVYDRTIVAKVGQEGMFEVLVGSSWTGLPPPTEWTWGYKDLSSDNSGRSLDGMMHKDIVAVKRTNNLSWVGKDNAVARTIMRASKNGVFVQFRYRDPFNDNWIQIRVYTGDITCTASNAHGGYIWQVALNFIEQ